MFAFIVGVTISLLSFLGLLAFCTPKYDRELRELTAMPRWMAIALALSNGAICVFLLMWLV